MWFSDLLTQPSYLQIVLMLSIICAVGLSLGQLKIKGVSLGVTLVFFAGILAGEVMDRFGISVDRGMISLAQNFGLILFVYALGVQVGPGFFPSLKKGGITLNLYGLLCIALTTVASVAAYALTSVSFSDSVGLLCGAATNTPMLGAAQQTLLDVSPSSIDQANSMATACAVGYPFGVIGVLVCMIVLKVFNKGNLKKPADPSSETYIAEFNISNPAIFGKTVAEIAQLSDKHIIISRLWRDGHVTIPSSKTILDDGDRILTVLKRADLQNFIVTFGMEEKDHDWNQKNIDWNHIDGSGLVSKEVLVSKPELNGVTIGSLKLRNSFNINITRIARAGVQLVAYQGFRLQLGDRLTVVGEETAIDKVCEILGNEQKVLNNPNLVALFIGLFLGVVLGSIPLFIPGMSFPIKLGIAGGPIIVGILMGAFGPRIHLSTYSTRSASLMIRQMGIVVYLACLGFSAGAGFFKTVFCLQGLLWIAISLFIAIVPCLIVGFAARKWGKIDYAQNAGMICAAMANPIALTYANTNSDEQEASEAYATVYPLSMFIRVISAQLLMLLFL